MKLSIFLLFNIFTIAILSSFAHADKNTGALNARINEIKEAQSDKKSEKINSALTTLLLNKQSTWENVQTSYEKFMSDSDCIKSLQHEKEVHEAFAVLREVKDLLPLEICREESCKYDSFDSNYSQRDSMFDEYTPVIDDED